MASSPFLMLPSANYIPQNSEFVECVGSSYGWLTYLDKHENPTLVDPFSGTRIPLPPSNTLPIFDYSNFLSSSRKIQKVFLSTNPSYSHAKNYFVVVLFGFQAHTKIAYCRGGDEEWSGLEREGKTYYDVVIHETTNTVFALGPPLSVASWDLNEVVPLKKMIIQDSCPEILINNPNFPTDLYSTQWYLALSQEQIYLVVRYIGDFVRYDGKVVYEGDTLTDEASEPLVCPYRTMAFHVFKLDADRNEWIKVETLNNSTLFLGGNQSTMLSATEVEVNAIYFTDDYWERIDEDYTYGGHDLGIYKLQDSTIYSILSCQQQKIAPPPFWVIKST